MDFATILNFRTISKALAWAEENLDKETYEKIKLSNHKIVKYTIIYTICLSIIFLISLISVDPLMDKYSADAHRTGHVLHENIWYIQNDKHELKLSDYGYNYQDFKEGEEFVVFLDKNNQVTGIAPKKEKSFEMNLPMIVMAGGLIGSIVLMLIFMAICYRTFGKDWHQFIKWFEKTGGTGEFTL